MIIIIRISIKLNHFHRAKLFCVRFVKLLQILHVHSTAFHHLSMDNIIITKPYSTNLVILLITLYKTQFDRKCPPPPPRSNFSK